MAGWSLRPSENIVPLLQHPPCSVVGTAIKTPNAIKLGSSFIHRGWRIEHFQHLTILSPVAAARQCLRLFQCASRSPCYKRFPTLSGSMGDLSIDVLRLRRHWARTGPSVIGAFVGQTFWSVRRWIAQYHWRPAQTLPASFRPPRIGRHCLLREWIAKPRWPPAIPWRHGILCTPRQRPEFSLRALRGYGGGPPCARRSHLDCKDPLRSTQ